MATVHDKKEFDILMVTSTAHKVASKNQHVSNADFFKAFLLNKN